MLTLILSNPVEFYVCECGSEKIVVIIYSFFFSFFFSNCVKDIVTGILNLAPAYAL